MTIYQKDPDAISNWFNAQLKGIGHRGSSFTDIDFLVVAALTHDGYSRRFLFQEFKRPHEETDPAQWWALADLARQPNTTVWLVRQCDGLHAVEHTVFHDTPRSGLLTAETIALEEYRRRYFLWWEQAPAHADDSVPSRIVWAEYVQHDPSLRDFIAAEIARAGIALDTATYNAQHYRHVSERLQQQIDELKHQRKARRNA